MADEEAAPRTGSDRSSAAAWWPDGAADRSPWWPPALWWPSASCAPARRPAGAAVAFVAVAAGVGIATWPVGGRTAEQWAPDAARHVDALRRQRKVRRREPFATLRFLDIDLARDGPTPVSRLAGTPPDRVAR